MPRISSCPLLQGGCGGFVAFLSGVLGCVASGDRSIAEPSCFDISID